MIIGRKGVGSGAAACPASATHVSGGADVVVVVAVTSVVDVGEASSAGCGVTPWAFVAMVGESIWTAIGGMFDESLLSKQLVETMVWGYGTDKIARLPCRIECRLRGRS